MTDILAKVFPGIAGMANIHPMIVHFPIALFNVFFLMELLGFLLKKEKLRGAASWMLYLGTLGAAAAVAAGIRAVSTLPHTEEAHATMQAHRTLGIVVLALAILLSVWRLLAKERFSLKAQMIHLAVAFVMAGVMAFGADMGGLMVYKYGVAVAAVDQPEGHDHSGGGHEEKAVGGEEVDDDHGSGVEDGHGDDEHSEPHGH
jgi:uncharacterized membrane protein